MSQRRMYMQADFNVIAQNKHWSETAVEPQFINDWASGDTQAYAGDQMLIKTEDPTRL